MTKNRPFIPKPLPKTGSLQDLAEAVVWSFQQLTPEQQRAFREETMLRVHHDPARSKWEEEHSSRPYNLEPRN